MLVISVNGVFRNKKYFYYVSEIETDNGDKVLTFNNNLDRAMVFDSLDEAMCFARDHYLELLKIMASGSAKMLTKTLAIRKMVFKVVRDIDENILNYDGNHERRSRVDGTAPEDSDALNEEGDTGSESESAVEEEVSDNASEASSSDLQENSEE